MTRFVVGDDRSQSTLFPERLEDYLSEDNPVRAVDVFVDELDLTGLDYPRTNSLPAARETTCSDCDHRQRQSASSNPPGKSPMDHIILGAFSHRLGHQRT